ncbi:hypothetical protein AN189_02940 [Loktanella sp. 3ANDIMAR09]|nr:hypothetical protein AN189_02940 [Loktanella sp. 3ANDIMAR09]
MTLTACAASDDNSAGPLPATVTITAALADLSPQDAMPCADPGISEGIDLRSILADHRVALGDCRRRHARVVTQYRGLQDRIISTGPPGHDR